MLWNKVKRALVTVLTGVMIIEGAIPMSAMAAETDRGGDGEAVEADGVSSVVIADADDLLRSNDKNPGFEGGASDNPVYWWYAAGAEFDRSDVHCEGSKSMMVTPAQAGGGVGSNLTDTFDADQTYQFTYYAKLAADADTQVSLEAVNGTIHTDETSYNFNADEWTKVSGTFSFPASAEERHLKFVSDSTTVFYVDDLRVAKEEVNLLQDPKFTVSQNGAWYATGDGKFSVSDNDPDVDTYGIITGRTQDWNCIAQNIKGVVKNNTKYNFSFKVRLADTVEDGTEKEFTFRTTQTDSAGTNYGLATTGGKANVGKDWTTISGTLDVKFSGTLSSLEYKMSEENKTNFVDYYVADAKLTEAGELKEVNVDYNVDKSLMGIKDAFARDGLGYSGVCLPASAIKDTEMMEYIQQHYNSVTCENEMKPESFLTTVPDAADEFPTLDFTQGDAVADAILALNEGKPAEQQIKMRGHVLVWHSQTPSWFFHEEWDTSKPYVSEDTMNKRLENYIKQVMQHYYAEDSKYKDLIYAWDVVNEQASDSNGIRIGTDWAEVYGGENTYILNAFVYANTYAPESVKLFYNDYNDCDARKCAWICDLIDDIQATPGARISGIGMQGHHNLVTPYTTEIENAIQNYADALDGGDIQVTELDFKGSDDYDGVYNDVEYALQGYRYLEFFNTLKKMNHKNGVNITGVTFWGTDDGHSWLNTFNGAGGGGDGKHKVCPLPFDKMLQAKPAYWAIVDPSKLPAKPPVTKSAAVSKANGTASASAQSFEEGNVKVSFAPVWNDGVLKVKVIVKDANYDATDAINVYVNQSNVRPAGEVIKTVVKREDCKAIEGGYETTVSIPLEGIKSADKIGFDIKVVDGTKSISWSDTTNDQDNKNVYFGTISLQSAVLMIQKGSPVSDNSAEWDDASDLSLDIVGSSPEATATGKVLWDETNLYVLMNVTDADIDLSAGADHEKDSVEIFIDEKNDKAGSYESDDKQYRINEQNVLTGSQSAKPENVKSFVKTTEDGYLVYAAIKWTDITAAKDSFIGLDLQINDGKGGKRIGTRNLFDATGNGWSNPSVFGTAKLIEGEIPKEPAEAATYKATVVNGTGSALYEEGATATIKANAAAEGKVFDKWTADSDVKFSDATKESTTFVMPAKAVTVTANYKDAPKQPTTDPSTPTTDPTKDPAKDPTVTEPEKPVVTYFAQFSVKSAKIQKGKTSTALAKDLKIAKEDKVAKWTSSNSKIVKVDKKTGTIKGMKAGKTAVITVTTESGKKASIKITVTKNKVVTTKLVVKNSKTSKEIKNKKSVSLNVGKTLKLTTVISPITSPEKVTFSTSNKKIATVSKTGKITAKKAGTATITVKSGKKTVKFKVKVSK